MNLKIRKSEFNYMHLDVYFSIYIVIRNFITPLKVFSASRNELRFITFKKVFLRVPRVMGNNNNDDHNNTNHV